MEVVDLEPYQETARMVVEDYTLVVVEQVQETLPTLVEREVQALFILVALALPMVMLTAQQAEAVLVLQETVLLAAKE